MDENAFINLIRAQVATLAQQADTILGDEARTTEILYNTLEELGGGDLLGRGEPRERDIPAGFADAAAFQAFKDEQRPVFENEDGEGYMPPIADVVGLVPNNDGNLVEVGNLDEAVERANAAVANHETHYVEDEDAYDAYGDEAYIEVRQPIETDNAITIAYRRLDGQPLSDANVTAIINHPISASLKHLGTLQLLGINAAEKPNQREAVFAVLEEGKIDLRTLAINVVSYKGVSVFPGIGQVEAVGKVNFA